MSELPLGFLREPTTLTFEKILPSHQLPQGLSGTLKYRQIVSSIEAVGLIEPLSVCKADKLSGMHLLLDGHIRLCALRELGFNDAPCLVAVDDERYTYNNRINRLSTVQEHFMIRRAVGRGVTPEKLANALSIDISNIIKKLTLLDGICPEAAGLLKDQYFSANIGGVLRKMKPMRQVECVELMLSAGTVTVPYAKALLAATASDMLVSGAKSKKMAGVTPEQMAKMEREMGNLQGQFKAIENTYGRDILDLVLARGYLTKLLSNRAVTRYLTQNQPEVLAEFSSLVQTETLGNDKVGF